jgi:hypothetical protein
MDVIHSQSIVALGLLHWIVKVAYSPSGTDIRRQRVSPPYNFMFLRSTFSRLDFWKPDAWKLDDFLVTAVSTF